MNSLAFTEPGDECPLCQCGTVEHVDGEARCMGECGEVAAILRSGDEVFWEDPDDGACSRHITIQSISINGEVVTVVGKDGSELECYAEELS